MIINYASEDKMPGKNIIIMKFFITDTRLAENISM